MALTEIELFKITGITQLTMMIYSSFMPKFVILEFVMLLVPQYFCTVYLEYINMVYLGCIAVLAALFLARPIPKTQLKPQDTIDRCRFVIISLVVIAIFSAEFRFYDSSKLGKSMTYGLKLMDIGVGSFVMNAGMAASRINTRKKLITAAKCLVLGLGRYLSIILFKLRVDRREFGTHLNFFTLLGIMMLLSVFIHSNFIAGFLLCVLYEVLLQLKLSEIILRENRCNWFMHNLEGFSYLIPQFGMFLMSGGLTAMYFKGKKRSVLYLWCTIGVTYLFTCFYSGISRRLHNLRFCMLIVFLHVGVCCVFEFIKLITPIAEFQLLKFSCRHLLMILLYSNILVFLNLKFNSFKNRSLITDHGVCVVYLLAVFYIPAILNNYILKRIKRKYPRT